jgi:SGNH hydrolase-like domain, acetyltransferase AlgX
MSPNSSTFSSESVAGRIHPSRTFVHAFVATAAALLLSAIAISLYLHVPDGDLVRIGPLAERDFEATALQPPLQTVASGPDVPGATIMLLGDSFSESNAWQSELTRLTGQRVRTWHYPAVGCIGDWVDRAIGGTLVAGAKTVIIESIERSFVSRFGDAAPCSGKAIGAPLDFHGGPPAPPRRPWAVFPIDIRHLVKTLRRYAPARRPGRYQSGETVVVDLVRDDLFSNVYRRRLTYFAGDDHRCEQWEEAEATAAVARLSAWHSRAAAAGVDLHVLLVPDKSSVYWPHIAPSQRRPYPECGERLHTLLAAACGPEHNLLPGLREQALAHSDLYRPDDTHFSAAGFRLMAAEVSHWVR